MRRTVHVCANALTAIAAFGFFTTLPQPALAGGTLPQNSTIFAVPAGYDELGYAQAYRYGYHYACWYEPYGLRFCGLWHGGDRPACPTGYYYTCRYGPSGYGNCGCY